jgi:hypothetical protein
MIIGNKQRNEKTSGDGILKQGRSKNSKSPIERDKSKKWQTKGTRMNLFQPFLRIRQAENQKLGKDKKKGAREFQTETTCWEVIGTREL